MIYLGIDLGTHCGYGVLDDDKVLDYGTWHLDQNLFEGGGWRYLVFRGHLQQLLAKHSPDVIGYELVRRHGKGNNTQAAHIWGGLRATLQTVLDEQQIPYTSLEIGTIKKELTGKGNASKELICEGVNTRWGLNLQATKKDDETDDNAADALAIALALQQKYLAKIHSS
jgi:crossover junction endodeoxyribonuclease RuvC